MWSRLNSSLKSFLPEPPDSKKEQRLYRELLDDAGWDTNYIVLTHTSCLIATFGLISNSTAVIIGAMLVAPLMLPLRGLAFGALEGDFNLFRKAMLAIAGGTVISIVLSWLIGLIAGIPEFGSEVLSRTQPNLVDLGIAVSAGVISAFAKLRPRVSDALAGTAISVALMPPLCVVGLSLSQGYPSLAKGAFLLYLTNLLGISLACMVIFIVAGYTEITHVLGWAVGLTAVLIIPLGASFLQLVRKAQLEAALQDKLVRETITVGQKEVELVRTRVNWTADPNPIVYLSVQVEKSSLEDSPEITPKQVREVENFLRRETGQKFSLVFLVSDVRQVTAQERQKVTTQTDTPTSQGDSYQKDREVSTQETPEPKTGESPEETPKSFPPPLIE